MRRSTKRRGGKLSHHLATLSKVAGYIPHPYAQTVSKAASVGSHVAGALGHGKKRRHRRSRR
jgi:hypothetical protein